MPEQSSGTTSTGGFKIPKFGPPPLKKIWGLIERRMNQITPVSGTGITVDQQPMGSQISLNDKPTKDSNSTGPGQGSGSGGQPVNVYGAFNGAPAQFHLLQSSPPTLL